jgi:ribosomal protein S12 methylthiotransferase accessory factor YcaO
VCYGLLEAIEREVSAIYDSEALRARYQQLAVLAPSIDAADLRIFEQADEVGFTVEFFDLPNPFEVPMIECRLRYRNELFGGMSCRLSREDAIQTSFHEALNSLYVVVAGSRDDMQIRSLAAPLIDSQVSPQRGRERASTSKRVKPRSLSDTVDVLLHRLRRAGYPIVWALDVTPRSAAGLQTCRILVPNFEWSALPSPAKGEKVARAVRRIERSRRPSRRRR